MACFRFRAQSQTQRLTQDFQSDFVAAVLLDPDLDVVFSSLFEVNCAGISGGQYAGTIFSAFFLLMIIQHPLSLRLEVQSLNFQRLIVPCY
jgi:hypothetical protein